MQQLLSDSIDDFISFRLSQHYSKGTVKNDRSVLTRFLTSTGNIYLHNITERHVTKFFETAARTRGSGAMRNDHAALSVFFDWGRNTKRMPATNNPLAGRRRPRIVQKERNRLHVSKFPALLDAAGESDPRNRMLVAALLYLLLRDREAADLRVGDVNLEAGDIGVRIFKSGSEDRMPISKELDAELRTWLRIYAEKVGQLRAHYYLIPRRNPVAVTERGADGRIMAHEYAYAPERPYATGGNTVKAALEAIGYPVTDAQGEPLREGSHTLRRSGARALFDQLVANGYDHALRIVQSMLHHKSVTQTEVYLGITADRRSRDDLLRGKPMYDISTENVVKMPSQRQV